VDTQVQSPTPPEQEGGGFDPKALDDTALEAAVDDLLLELQDLDHQLGDRNKVHPDGTRYGDQEYWRWRTATTDRRVDVIADYRAAKHELRRRQTAKIEAERAERRAGGQVAGVVRETVVREVEVAPPALVAAAKDAFTQLYIIALENSRRSIAKGKIEHAKILRELDAALRLVDPEWKWKEHAEEDK
jgi:hypothetical protein